MENTITETTTGSANGQNSVHPSPRLYAGVATLLVLVLAAAIVGPKLLHESAVSARHLRRLLLSASLCNET